MLLGVASLPPSLIPALQNIGILHHKKAKLCIHMRQSVYILDLKTKVFCRKENQLHFHRAKIVLIV